ncbi:MAG: hypothetical protein JST61_14420 [Acidobacteria bacterium]|nr:hypothetical protein [Acidobacteriota bacterium]
MTRELAHRIGIDEANRYMKNAGRTSWSQQDYAYATATFQRLWPCCIHQLEPGECSLCN